MEMCYSGALVMPSSCAVMSEDEMTYVDGGIKIAPVWLVAGAINLAIDAVVVGGARMAAKYFTGQVRKYGAQKAGLLFSKTLKRKLMLKGIGASAAAGACNLAAAGITLLTWAVDPGGSLASFINSRDKNPRNNWIDI